MEIPYFNPDFWKKLPNIDPDFFYASETFGGTLDLSGHNIVLVSAEPENLVAGVAATRALCARPLNIFDDIVRRMGDKSENLKRFNSEIKRGYIRSKTPNAYCWRQGEYTYIGVTSGLVQFIYGVISHLLSFQEFMFDRIDGASLEERGQLASIKDGIDFKAMLEWELGSSLVYPKYRIPKGDDRRLMAFNITHLAILFVLFHELGHAYCRHNEFINQYCSECVIHELQSPNGADKDLDYLAHRFELLADGFALELSLKIKLGTFSSKLADASDYYQWSLGVDLLLWIFAQRLLLTDNSGDHPHPQLRILNKVMHITKGNYGWPGKEIAYDRNANKPIRDIALLASVDLFEFWKTNELVGWDNSFFHWDAQDKRSELVEEIQRKETPLWLQYERYVDHRIIREAIYTEY